MAHRSGHAAAACLVLALVGCTASVEPVGTTDTTPTSSPPATSASPGGSPTQEPTDDQAADAGTWLYELPSKADRASGEQTDADLAGDGSTQRFAHSTAQWVGCDGAVDSTTYRLEGGFRQLKGQVALREGVPDGLVVEVGFAVDGAPVSRIRVEADGGAPVQLVLTGSDTLTVTAEATAGTCDEAAESYLVLADATVT